MNSCLGTLEEWTGVSIDDKRLNEMIEGQI